MADTWSYSTGQWGYNRVRVYEREPGRPIQIEWTGGKRQTLTNVANVPIYDRTHAMQIADALARRLDRGKRGDVARDVLGLPQRHTFGELVGEYHKSARADGWSPAHRKTQERMRDWWLARLGRDAALREIKPAHVENIVKLEAKRHGWSKRTRQKYLRYVTGAFTFARRKLKWIEEAHDLSAVEMPKPDSRSLPYSRAEMLKLLDAAPGVNLQIHAVLEIAYATQRRINAIRHLRRGDYRVENGLPVLTFGEEQDKARRTGEAVLTPSAQRAVEMLLPRTREWLIPAELDRPSRPAPYETLNGWLRQVEKKAKVQWVAGRGFHGVKRRAVTDARQAVGHMGVVGKQSGTLASTLERVYEQDDLAPKAELARKLELLRRGA